MPDPRLKRITIPKDTFRNDIWRQLACSTRIVFMVMMMDNVQKNKRRNTVRWKEADIAIEASINISTVKRGIKELIKFGLVNKTVYGGRWHSGSEYWLNPDYTGWDKQW